MGGGIVPSERPERSPLTHRGPRGDRAAPNPVCVPECVSGGCPLRARPRAPRPPGRLTPASLRALDAPVEGERNVGRLAELQGNPASSGLLTGSWENWEMSAAVCSLSSDLGRRPELHLARRPESSAHAVGDHRGSTATLRLRLDDGMEEGGLRVHPLTQGVGRGFVWPPAVCAPLIPADSRRCWHRMKSNRRLEKAG
ncbi:unnamed protein product [Boreogadus saida]